MALELYRPLAASVEQKSLSEKMLRESLPRASEHVRVITTVDALTPEQWREVAEVHRESLAWNNGHSWNEYIRWDNNGVYEYLSANEVFGVNFEEMLSQGYTLKGLEKHVSIDQLQHTYPGAEYVWKVEDIIFDMQSKLFPDGHMTVLCDSGGTVGGFMSGYSDSFENVWEHEWSQLHSKETKERFWQKLCEEVPTLLENDRVAVISMVALDPRYRGSENFSKLRAAFFRSLPKREYFTPLIAETNRGSSSHVHGMNWGGKELLDTDYENCVLLLVARQLKDILPLTTLNHKEYVKASKEYFFALQERARRKILEDQVVEIINKMRGLVEGLAQQMTADFLGAGTMSTPTEQVAYQVLSRNHHLGSEEIVKCISELSGKGGEFVEYSDEASHFDERGVRTQGLATYDAVRCLEDFEGRTLPFVQSIIRQVRVGDRVLEIGTGTAVLAITAAMCGAKEVVAVEINPVTAVLAEQIVQELECKGIIPRGVVKILQGDFFNFGTKDYKEYVDEPFDVLISENIYPGTFYENQVQLVNHVHQNGFLRDVSPVVIPRGLSSGVELVQVDPSLQSTMEVGLDLDKRGVSRTVLSEGTLYDCVDFTRVSPECINAVVHVRGAASGVVNALGVFSDVILDDEATIRRDTNDFLTNSSYVRVEDPLVVQEGDPVRVTLEYARGAVPQDGCITVEGVVRKSQRDIQKVFSYAGARGV